MCKRMLGARRKSSYECIFYLNKTIRKCFIRDIQLNFSLFIKRNTFVSFLIYPATPCIYLGPCTAATFSLRPEFRCITSGSLKKYTPWR